MEKLYNGLNKEVANFSVLFTKLHHFHWYVEGPAFFTLHVKLEEFYDEINEKYDEFAERLLTIGGKPISTLKQALELTSLKEATKVGTATEMVTELKNDFEVIVKELKVLIPVSQENNDEATADMLIGTVSLLEKHLWMLRAYLK